MSLINAFLLDFTCISTFGKMKEGVALFVWRVGGTIQTVHRTQSRDQTGPSIFGVHLPNLRLQVLMP
jgi:hypothetical protein